MNVLIMKCFSVAFFVLLVFGTAQAQDYDCGLDAHLLSEKEAQAAFDFYARDRAPIPKINQIDSVAVTIHVIETVAGAANITYAELEAEINRVNRAFSAAGIAFFICGSPRYIRGDALYRPQTSDALHSSHRVPNTINIYYAEELEGSEGTPACGYAYLPFGRALNERYVMMRKSCSTDGAVLAHELGHFYGLWHTHETRYGREFVDGTNCSRAGDLLCDTPADPNLGEANRMSGCRYIGDVRDPRGRLYTPPVSNLMSYAPSHCQRNFSAEQTAIMREIHLEDNAALARVCDFYPDFSISTATDRINIRSDQDITIEYDFQGIAIDQDYEVDLYVALADLPDEDGFILLKEKVNIRPGQTGFSQTFDIDFPISRGTGLYYLKAFLDSEYQVIERTESNNYAATTIRVDNSGLADVLLFPNPVQDELKLFFRDRRAEGRMYIRIFRYDGRLVFEDEVFKNDEEFFKVLDVSWLSTGLYVATVDFEKVNREYSFKFLKQ